MKRILTYLFPLAALLAGSCSEERISTDRGDGKTGILAMSVSATRNDAESDYDPLQHLVVRIYNEEGGLLRKYASKEAIPERLALLAGNYRVAVEAGEAAEADFVRRLYTGEETFTVSAGGMTPVEVKCALRSTTVAVAFDASVENNFEAGYTLGVAVGGSYDPDRIAAGEQAVLNYTTAATGYFTLPENEDRITWRFSGRLADDGSEFQQEKSVSGLKPGGRYSLSFKFSPSTGTLQGILISTVDPDKGEDDTIVFGQDPTIEGVGFDLKEPQRYTGGDRTVLVTTVADLQRIVLTVDGAETTLYSAAQDPTTLPEGIRLEQTGEKEYAITLSEAWIERLSVGSHTIAFRVTDNANGDLTATTDFRMPGLLPVTEDSYDLWHNTLTLRAIAFDAAPRFSLQAEGTAVQEATGTTEGDDLYTARFVPEWETSTNAQGYTVYSIKAGTGIRAGMQYTYGVTLNGTVRSATFRTPDGDAIPDGDMEDGALPCFTTGGSAGTTFWGSGNNSNTKTLCTQGGTDGNRYARLQSTFYIAAPAAGNLFTGTFTMSGTTGTVGFGQKYTYTARPAALKVKYHAQIGAVTYNKGNGPLAVGAQDKGIIYAAIVDWSSRHMVSSKFNIIGTSSCTGSWNPENGPDAVSEGKILGYAVLWIEESSTGDALVDAGDALKIYWYDKDAAAPEGNYTLVISGTANAYGDYFDGCDTNHLWLDDFKWAY